MAMHQHSKRFQKKITNVTSHVRNLIILATELYNKIENLAAPIMHDVLNIGISNIVFAHKLTFRQDR